MSERIDRSAACLHRMPLFALLVVGWGGCWIAVSDQERDRGAVRGLGSKRRSLLNAREGCTILLRGLMNYEEILLGAIRRITSSFSVFTDGR